MFPCPHLKGPGGHHRPPHFPVNLLSLSPFKQTFDDTIGLPLTYRTDVPCPLYVSVQGLPTTAVWKTKKLFHTYNKKRLRMLKSNDF